VLAAALTKYGRHELAPLATAMNTFLWIVAGQLAVVFLASGARKVTQPKEKLAANGMGWTEDFSAKAVVTIGALELLAALGLILPAVFDVMVLVVPIAALGLVLLMAGAATSHAKRHELHMILVNLVLAGLASVVVWGRFGPYAFGA
jgi:hypothetical protein